MKQSSRLSLLLPTALVFAQCVFALSQVRPTPETGRQKITVSANQLFRDGVAWTPHGINSIAFVAPSAAQDGVFRSAYDHFNPAELASMKTWGNDTVRLQVSQPGLDPQNPLFSAGFVTSVKNAVLAARATGLNVIVSVQDEHQSGEGNPVALPDQATQRVWQLLSPIFNNDTGVLYEILNEPELPPNPRNWAAWRDSMNTVIRAIRATGSANVVIADGLRFAETFHGAPRLTDSSQQLAYAAHPYFHNAIGQDAATWDDKFGNFATKSPVIVTEWTTIVKYYCDAQTPQAAIEFLRYLQDHHIGLIAWAYDFDGKVFGSTVTDFQGTPSTFANERACGSINFGPGTLIQAWYRTGRVPTMVQ